MGTGIIQTRSGIAFDLLKPDPDTILLDDIAWALSNICRFNGHCSRFYSVAEHCASGALYMAGGYGRAMQRAFLLHDAAEAYIGDICRPLKLVLGPAIAAIERGIQDAINAKFGIGLVPSAHLKAIDDAMLSVEARQLMRAPLVGDWPDFSDSPLDLEFRGLRSVQAYEDFLDVAGKLGVS